MKHYFGVTLMILTACTGLSRESPGPLPDLLPPLLLDFREEDDGLIFRFDENIRRADWQFEGLGEPVPALLDGTPEVKIILPGELTPGVPRKLLLEVEDAGGNRNLFFRTFYPRNRNLPALQITEVSVNGSSTRPDMVELLVREDGILTGAEVRDGIPGEESQSVILPPVPVSRGERLLIHFKSTGGPGEISETRHRKESSAGGSRDDAWDFWVTGGTGLNGSNGVILVMDRPGGTCMDALAYSNRTSGNQDRYGGFGTRQMQESVLWLEEKGAWAGSGEVLLPEDCVPSGATTSLRTLCRKEGSDTDRESDWFTAVRSSFGEPNPPEVYPGPGRKSSPGRP